MIASIASASNAKWTLVGLVLLGLSPSTSVFAQARQMPPEITITQSAVRSIVTDLESYVTALESKCDKCDSSTKSGSRKAVAALRKAVNDLEKTTNSKVADIIKACK